MKMRLHYGVTVVLSCCFLLLFLSAVSAGDSALTVVPSDAVEDDGGTVVASEVEEQIEQATSDEVFVATHEWQVVKPGAFISWK